MEKLQLLWWFGYRKSQAARYVKEGANVVIVGRREAVFYLCSRWRHGCKLRQVKKLLLFLYSIFIEEINGLRYNVSS